MLAEQTTLVVCDLRSRTLPGALDETGDSIRKWTAGNNLNKCKESFYDHDKATSIQTYLMS
jgi:hypothetical protein